MAVTHRELAQRLRTARRANHVTQASAARVLRVSRSAISQIESGNRNISGLELHRLARLYGRDIGEFLEEEFSEVLPIRALFRAHPDVSLDDVAKQSLARCVELQRHVANLRWLLGMEPGVASVPTYSSSVPQSTWDAVQQGRMAAEDERSRLDLGTAPLPDVADLLEAQGISTAQVVMDDNISGLALIENGHGILVVANERHHILRRRFSFAHEYAHVLLDRDRKRILSHVNDRSSTVEVRANAFAAAFLMPAEGVSAYVLALEKGRRSRDKVEIFDEDVAMRAERRFEPGSQDLRMHDVVRLAHHFRVSCSAMLFRLKGLRLLSEADYRRLTDEYRSGLDKTLRRLLDLPEPDHAIERTRFRARFLGLAIEAFVREKISRRKLDELGVLANVPTLSQDLHDAGLFPLPQVGRQSHEH